MFELGIVLFIGHLRCGSIHILYLLFRIAWFSLVLSVCGFIELLLVGIY